MNKHITLIVDPSNATVGSIAKRVKGALERRNFTVTFFEASDFPQSLAVKHLTTKSSGVVQLPIAVLGNCTGSKDFKPDNVIGSYGQINIWLKKNDMNWMSLREPHSVQVDVSKTFSVQKLWPNKQRGKWINALSRFFGKFK